MEKQQSKKREKRMRLEEIIPDDEMRTEMLSRLYKGDPILGDKGIFTNLLQSFVNAALEGEMNNFLDESKTDSSTNRRNGHTSKSVRSTAGPLAIQHDGSFDEKNLTYDANGNILTLHRYGAGNNPIDLLSYTYLSNSNQISYIIDPAGDVSNVVDYPGGTFATQGFQYDQNGNMTISVDKGLNVPIVYNYLNKPEELNFGNGEKLDYIYDGMGTNLAKIVKDGDALPENSLIYSGNFVYDLNHSLQYILTSEGRLVPDNDSYRFEYFMKDHLGNTRATYAEAVPGLVQVAEYQHYYPFGMQLEALCYSSGADLPNNHLYNGKELQMDYGLEWYDYGARFYDPQIGRWSMIDNEAEKYSFTSPYTYALNNPIKFLDPDGKKVRLINAVNKNNQGNYVYESGVSSVVNALLTDIVNTAEGRAYIGQFATAGQTIGGYTFEKNGACSDQDLIIQDFSLSKYEGDQIPISNEGTHITRVNEKEGKTETYIQLMSFNKDKANLGVIASEEMLLHGYSDKKKADAYKTGGKSALDKMQRENPYGKKDHRAYNTKDKNHEGYKRYLNIKDQLITKDPSYQKYFDDAAKEERWPN